MSPRPLTQKRLTFANEYLKTGNACEAYRRAYPRSLGWKVEAVEQSASHLLADPKVYARVKELRAKAESAAVATRQEVLEVLTRIVRCSPSDLLSPDGTIDLDKLRTYRQEVGEITVEDTPLGRRHKVKMRDVVAAADRMAKLQGWDQPQRIHVEAPRLDYRPDPATEAPPVAPAVAIPRLA